MKPLINQAIDFRFVLDSFRGEQSKNEIDHSPIICSGWKVNRVYEWRCQMWQHCVVCILISRDALRASLLTLASTSPIRFEAKCSTAISDEEGRKVWPQKCLSWLHCIACRSEKAFRLQRSHDESKAGPIADGPARSILPLNALRDRPLWVLILHPSSDTDSDHFSNCKLSQN